MPADSRQLLFLTFSVLVAKPKKKTVNAIGTQLRDLINSGLTRWRMEVYERMKAAAEIGRNPVKKHPIQPECGE